MRILQITPRIPYPAQDGGAIAMQQVTEGLLAKGHQVILASLNPLKVYLAPAAFPKHVELYITTIDTTVRLGPAVRSLFQQQLPYPILRFYSRAFAAQLSTLVENHYFDIIQLEGLHLAPYLSVLRRRGKSKIILRAHNVESLIWKRLAHSTRNPFLKLAYHYLAHGMYRYEKRILSSFDAIIAISTADASRFREMGYLGELKTIPAGVQHFNPSQDAGVALLGAEPSPNTLCYLGALNWEPNLQGMRWFLDKVWPLILAWNPGATFHLAGKGMLPEVKRWASKYQGLTIHGEVPDATTFLAQYAGVVVPLLAGSGIRLKLLDALSLGKAVVSTSVGAEGLGLTSGKELLLADNPSAFADACIGLLADKPLNQSLGLAGKAFVYAHFRADIQVAAFEAIYTRLLAC